MIIIYCRNTLKITSDYRLFHSLARCERKLGNNAEAAKYYQQALDTYSSDDEKFKKIILAGLKASLGLVEQAIKLYEESGIFQKNDALIEEMRQENTSVISHISQSASNVGVVDQIAVNFQVFNNVSVTISDGFQISNNAPPIEAFNLCLTNLEFFRRTGDLQGEAATLYEMACLKTKQGNVKEATKLFLKSLEIDERTNNIQGKASTLSMMGQLLSKRGGTPEALNYLKEALAIFEQLKSPETDLVRDLIASLVYK